MIKNITAYLDEAGDEPQSACNTLISHNIHHVVLRDVWTGNVCQLSDSGHSRLRSVLQDNDISTIMIASTLGRIDYRLLGQITDKHIQDCVNVARFYDSAYVRIFGGEVVKQGQSVETSIVIDWFTRVSQICEQNGIKCLYEITSDSALFNSAEVARSLRDVKGMGLVYDATGLILKHNLNTFVKYWSLLKKWVDIIDVRDLKIGQGFKVAGQGNSMIDKTICDAMDDGYKGWLALEPSLGRKYGSATTKQQTFAYAVDGLMNVLAQPKVVV